MYLGLNCRKIVLTKAILSDHHIDEVGTVIALFAGKENQAQAKNMKSRDGIRLLG